MKRNLPETFWESGRTAVGERVKLTEQYRVFFIISFFDLNFLTAKQ
jgi:hypothetical protein